MMKKRLFTLCLLTFAILGCGGSSRHFKDQQYNFEIDSPAGWHQSVKKDVTTLLLTYSKSKKIEKNPSIQMSVQPEMGYDAMGYLEQILLSGINADSIALDNVPVEYLEEPNLVERDGLAWAQTKIRLKNYEEVIYVLVTDRQTYILSLKIVGKFDEKEMDRIFRRVWSSFKLLSAK